VKEEERKKEKGKGNLERREWGKRVGRKDENEVRCDREGEFDQRKYGGLRRKSRRC
jgi:hypothetical protein